MRFAIASSFFAQISVKIPFVISDINDWLRDILKYNSEKNSEDALEAFEKTRKEIFSLMERWNVTYEL